MFRIAKVHHKIPLSGKNGDGVYTLVDPGLSRSVRSIGAFYLHPRGYAHRPVPGHRTLLLHREIMGVGNSGREVCEIDHINGDKLDNRKANLRYCTSAENHWNVGPRGGRLHKGACYSRRDGTWSARIKVNKQRFNLGTFKTEEEALVAYNEAAKCYHGDFAKTTELRPGKK